MLWKKGWKETRLRMLLLILATLALGLVASPREGRKSQASLNGVDAMTLFGASVLGAVMLAGAGIKTQAGGFRPSKGLHGSMIYTLSLPVTRTRIFGVRVAFGLAETFAIHVFAGCIAWLTQPQLRVTGHPVNVCMQSLAAFFYVATVYSLGVFFASFLDDLYQTWATIVTVVGTIVLVNRVSLPRFFERFLVLSQASPLNTHELPWMALTAMFVLSAGLMAASLRIIRAREF